MPSTADIPEVFGNLKDYIQSSLVKSRACIDQHQGVFDIGKHKASGRIHYIKLDKDGEPKLRPTARVLVKHICNYCHSAKARGEILSKETVGIDDDDSEITPPDPETELFLIARDYFRKIDTAGELGELLLFFILETFFLAPQVVSKMELKTNPGDEVKRSDGIYIGWDAKEEQCLVYLGESKLYGGVRKAISDALQSIATLYPNRADELRLLTTHFKHLSPPFQKAVSEWVNDELDESRYQVINVCLIGYDWDHYKQLAKNPQTFVKEFSSELSNEITRLVPVIDEVLQESPVNHLRFEFILFPFRSVQEFRTIFLTELTGMNKTEEGLLEEITKLRSELKAAKKQSKT